MTDTRKNELEAFLEYLEKQAACGAIYVWGGQGQAASKAFIKRHESGANEKKALALYKERLAKGYDPENIRCFDCSGLGMYWLFDKTRTFPGDMTANGMLSKCRRIEKGEVRRGDWVFKCYRTGARTAYHIGYVVSDAGDVIEARGRAYGVVRRALSAGGWNAFGRPRVFEAQICADAAEFARNLKKGCCGADVRELQKLLNSRGSGLEEDGEFGSKTRAAVRAFQAAERISVDGIAGKVTIGALGGSWKGKK